MTPLVEPNVKFEIMYNIFVEFEYKEIKIMFNCVKKKKFIFSIKKIFFFFLMLKKHDLFMIYIFHNFFGIMVSQPISQLI